MKAPAIALLIGMVIGTGGARTGSRSGDLRITRDTTVSGNIVVAESLTLIIERGVTIRFAEYKNLMVQGFLVAGGTADKPIVFTCPGRQWGSRDEPCWQGIVIRGGNAQATFRHCRFEGAFRNIVWGATPVFDSCEFTGNHYALYCTAKSAPHVRNCRFVGNTYGVFADFAAPLLLGNTITENRIGLQLQLSSQPAAGKNTIIGNGTDIHTEKALGQGGSGMSIQSMWDALKAVY